MTELTYGRVLLLFVVVPIVVLGALLLRDRRSGRGTAAGDVSSAWLLPVLVVVAVLYTFPWDNHLIATDVWSYNPALINGLAFDHVPLEELLFFPLQTVLNGLWFLWLAPRLLRHGTGERADAKRDGGGAAFRWGAAAMGGAVWLAALVVVLSGWAPGTYLGWELAWALPPLLLQLALGGDILWRRRRLLLAALVPAVLYLCAVDALAISRGIWTISPQRSLGTLLGGVLPLEELVFFTLTSTLVTVGLALGGAPELRQRLRLALRLGVAS